MERKTRVYEAVSYQPNLGELIGDSHTTNDREAIVISIPVQEFAERTYLVPNVSADAMRKFIGVNRKVGAISGT